MKEQIMIMLSKTELIKIVEDLVAEHIARFERQFENRLWERTPEPEASRVFRDDDPLTMLSLSNKAVNILGGLGCKTIGDVTKITEFELAKTRNCGRATVYEVKCRLARCGRALSA